jgi:peptidoglycan/LPS O-acetylase OafA/YrhL
MAHPEEKNCFDLIRLVLALLVVYSHAYLVGGFGVEGFSKLIRGQSLAGSIAVTAFFGISGFLVSRSFAVRHDGMLFLKARILRIFPGLYFSLLLTAFVFAPLISKLNPLSTGWKLSGASHYVWANLLARICQWNIGGVLKGLPCDASLDGALWSLFPELCCYGLVLFLGLTGALQSKRANLLLCLFAFLVLHFSLVLSPHRENLAPTLISLTGWASYIAAFLVGAALYAFKDQFGLGGRQEVFWWAVVAVLLKFGGWALIGPIALPAAIIHSAYAFSISLPADFSYGIYILHFPILQLLAAAGVNRSGFVAYFTVGVLVTWIFSTLSWYCVEKPALALKAGKPIPAFRYT